MGHSYRDLIAWQKSKRLAVEVYRATETLPRIEIYGLVSQMRRAAVSVPSNLAEGQGRLNPGEFRQFVGQARGSLLELQTQAAIAFDLGYLSPEKHRHLAELSEEVLRILNALAESLSKAPSRHSKRNSKLETGN